MKPLPHAYTVNAAADAEGSVRLTSHDLPALDSAPPREFDGPGDLWSPEELLLASIADCFVLTFRAVARASKLSWRSIDVRADGVLARVERVTRFTEITLHAALTADATDTPEDKMRRLLEKAEEGCLITRSLAVPVQLEARILR